MTTDRTVKPLTMEQNLFDRSDCTYMGMWIDTKHDEFEFGLLLCEGKYKLQRNNDFNNDDHEGTERAVFLIVCQKGVHICKCEGGQWKECSEEQDYVRSPGNFILLEFDKDYLFVMPDHQNDAVQLKVHDLRPASKKPRTLSPSIPHPSTQTTDMRTLLHRMSLCSNKM